MIATPKRHTDELAQQPRRIEAQRTIEAQAQQLEELGRAYDAMRDTVMDLTP